MSTTFANTIDGNPLYAARAVADAAGNDIQTTYATKSEVTTGLSGKQDTISDLATIRSGAADGATAVQPGDLSTVATTGAYSDLTGTPTIPTATSDLTNDSGFITLSDVPAQVQADWTESDTSDPSYIQNKPSIPSATSDLTNDSGFITLSDVPAQVNADWNSSSGASEILNKPTIPSGTQLVPASTSADADKVLTVDSQGTPAWSTPAAGGVTDVEVDGTSVVSGGVASITMPTVDQTYDASSTNAQSGTAVAGAIATKEDAFDVGTGLEMDTSGSTPTLQVEAPVDIVAGPGIAIDNPDGNTLRVSTDENYEVVLWETTSSGVDSGSITVSEAITNFEKYEIYGFETERGGTFVNTFAYSQIPFDYSSVITKPNDNNGSYAFSINMFCAGNISQWRQTYFGCRCHWNSTFTTMTIDSNHGAYVNKDANGTFNSINQKLRITKIIGIHRTASN